MEGFASEPAAPPPAPATKHSGVYSEGATGCDFSELFKHSGGLCQFSPSGSMVAVVVEHRLLVRDAETTQIDQLFSCTDTIDSVVWSPDSAYVLCTVSKRTLVEVFAVRDPNWSCRINEGVAGLTSACWSPDSRHILTTSEFQLQMTVWSLLDRSQLRIANPKLPASTCAITADGEFLAVPHRRECKDRLSVYHIPTWDLAAEYALDSTDLEEVVWSPDGSTICVRDTPLEFRVLLYSADGQLLSQYRAYENALGAKSVAWSPDSKLLAIGSYDGMARLLNALTWKGLAEYGHEEAAARSSPSFYREELTGDDALVEAAVRSTMDRGSDAGSATATRRGLGRRGKRVGGGTGNAAAALSGRSECDYETEMRVVAAADAKARSVAVVAPDPTKANPRTGVGLLCWSACGRYLATRNDNMPNTVWIWSRANFALAAVLEMRGRVLSAKWDPARPRLAVVTGTNKLFLWSSEGVTWVQVPAEGWGCRGLRWCPKDGNSLVLLTRQRFVVCYLAPQPAVAPL